MLHEAAQNATSKDTRICKAKYKDKNQNR